MRRSLSRKLALTALGWATLVALPSCKSRTGVVRTGPHQPDVEGKPIRVKKPPPPVRVEAIPLRRNTDCFYRDGAWIAEAGAWVWQKGEWILPPPGCYYAPPTTAYEDFDVGTALVHRPGYWHPRVTGLAECKEPRACPAPEGK